MATKHSKEHANPLKKKFVSPNANRKASKFPNISPKFKSNFKEFHKFSQQGKKEGSLKKKLYEWKKEKRAKYYLGGNSSDPLNLNSLIDRDPMLSTPQASPHPTHGDSPIDVCYPQHDNDPLNLKCAPGEDLKEGQTPKKKKKKKNKHSHNDIENKVGKNQNNELVEQSKEKKKKKKHKKAKTAASGQQESVSDSSVVSEEVKPPRQDIEQVDNTLKKSEEKSEVSDNSDDEPPQKKRRKSSSSSADEKSIGTSEESNEKHKEVVEEQTKQESATASSSITSKEHSNFRDYKPKNKKSNKVFIYGNYNRYYTYRNPHFAEDLRVKTFCREWFAGKDVLDIGCNVGDVTIYIAKHFEPRIIIGNDIDNALIKIAKSKCQGIAQSSACMVTSVGKTKFPMSFALTNGPIAVPCLIEKEDHLKFPKNVIFKQENYVPADQKSLANQKPMYDTILCLSVTKWVHLNWGDQGLKRMFKKIYNNLRPGGRLILEPQPFASYKKRRKLTEKIRANYNNICFRPEQFIDYLLSDEVGFVAYEVVEEPQHGVPGFRRSIYLLTKATGKMSSS